MAGRSAVLTIRRSEDNLVTVIFLIQIKGEIDV